MFWAEHFHRLSCVHTNGGKLHTNGCFILTELENNWVFFAVFLVCIFNLFWVTQPVHFGGPVSSYPIEGFTSFSKTFAFSLRILTWTVIIDSDTFKIFIQRLWIQVQNLGGMIKDSQVSLFKMFFLATDSNGMWFFSQGDWWVMLNILEHISEILLWHKIIVVVNMLLWVWSIMVIMKRLRLAFNRFGFSLLGWMMLLSFGLSLLSGMVFFCLFRSSLFMLRFMLALGFSLLFSFDWESFLLLSVVHRVKAVMMTHLTTGAVMSHGMLLRELMRWSKLGNELVKHFTMIIGVLLKILFMHIASIFILTESLVSLIFGLDISLVIIFGIDDLKLLMNLTVGIQLDKSSILDVVLL